MSARPTSGVRYALERMGSEPDEVTYQGFAHLPERDVVLVARIALPGGTVLVQATPTHEITAERAAELAKIATALVRAATKAEVAAGQPLPRKIVRWRP